MFESPKAFLAEVKVKRARAALRRAQALEVRRQAKVMARQARLARRVERAARRWEAAREAEAVRDLRAMARRNLRRRVVIDLTPRPW